MEDEDDLDAMISAALTDDPRAFLHDSAAALEHVRLRGDGLTRDERAEIERRAHEAIAHTQRMDRLECMGAVTTGPASAAEGMRARREADRQNWQCVLEALRSKSAGAP